jgi:hypothetical protein
VGRAEYGAVRAATGLVEYLRAERSLIAAHPDHRVAAHVARSDRSARACLLGGLHYDARLVVDQRNA